MEVTRDDGRCDHSLFGATEHTFGGLINNNKAEERLILIAPAHTVTVCVRPGFCRAEQVVSQQSPYGLELQSGTQRWKDGKGRRRTGDGARKR